MYCIVADGFASYETSAHIFANGAAAASKQCVLGYDVDDLNSGGFEFRSDTPGERIIYHDTGSANDGKTVAFGATNCK